jgi:hypothetical protein
MPINLSIFPAYFYNSFKASSLLLRSMIHLELTLVLCERYGSSFSFLNADIQLSQQHLLKRLSFLHRIFLRLSQKSDGLSCVDSYLEHLFSSTGFHIWFSANTCYFYCYGSVV